MPGETKSEPPPGSTKENTPDSTVKPPSKAVPEKSAISVTSKVRGNVFVDGVLIGKSPVDKLDLDSGTHDVKVSAVYYDPWTQTVTLKPGESLDITADPKLAGGSVIIESDPDGSSVFLDGKEAGTTPLILGNLAEGTHEVVIKREGFARYSHDLKISKDKPGKIIAKLEKPLGELAITSVSGARISIDGKAVGSAPLTLKLAKGTYAVSVSKKGYQTFKRNVTLDTSGKFSVHANLVRIGAGSLHVIAIPWADIYINGKKAGTTPKVIHKVPAGRVTVKLVNPGFTEWHKIVNVKRDRRLTISHTFASSEALKNNRGSGSKKFEGSVGSLKITSRVEGYVYVDGKRVGKTPVVLSDLKVGQHTVMLKREGMPDYNRRVSVVDGIVTRLAIE